MGLVLRRYEPEDVERLTKIWNEITAEGNSFPGDKLLSVEEAGSMFGAQSAVTAAFVDGVTAGLYILHPNNIGRCGHIANASYAVTKAYRGKGVGRSLVEDSLRTAKECGFRGLQFNAVVATNTAAVALYKKLGFVEIGIIPGGFRMDGGQYTDIKIFYHHL